MKKMLTLVLAVVLVLSLIVCASAAEDVQFIVSNEQLAAAAAPYIEANSEFYNIEKVTFSEPYISSNGSGGYYAEFYVTLEATSKYKSAAQLPQIMGLAYAMGIDSSKLSANELIAEISYSNISSAVASSIDSSVDITDANTANIEDNIEYINAVASIVSEKAADFILRCEEDIGESSEFNVGLRAEFDVNGNLLDVDYEMFEGYADTMEYVAPQSAEEMFENGKVQYASLVSNAVKIVNEKGYGINDSIDGEEKDNSRMIIVSDLFVEEIGTTPLNGAAIYTTSMDGNLLYMRLKWFIRRFNCGIYLSLWNSLDDNPNYETLDDVCEDVLKNPYDDTLYIFYVKDTNEVFLHREGIFEERLSDSDVQHISELITSSEVESDYYRFINATNELWRIFGEAPTTTYISLDGTADTYNEKIARILNPIRRKFDGHIQVECLYSDDADSQEYVEKYISIWNNRNEDPEYLSHFEDSIYIYYIGNTGDTFINIGSNTGLKVKDLESVQAAFKPAENNSDYSGFAAGIAALDKALSSNSFSTMAVAIAVLAVVIVLGGVVYVIIKKIKGVHT